MLLNEKAFDRYKKDFIRFFSTYIKRERLNKKILEHKNYCLKNMDSNTSKLGDKHVNEIEKYWDKVSFAYKMDPVWHQMYTGKTGIYSPKYISNSLHYYFTEYKLINFDYLRAFTDKNYLGFLFSDIKQPKTIIKCINGIFYNELFQKITRSQAVEAILKNINYGIVIKPSISSWGGRNILFLKGSKSVDEIEKVFKDYGKNFIVQGVLKQHEKLAAIHSESVNTIRIITILLNGEVNVLSACLRMGVGKSQVDNFSQGGIGCGIKADGQLRNIGYDRYGNKVCKHPDGFQFEECVVPNYDKVVDTVKKAALRVPMFGVASWDFAVDEDGIPVLIEYNVGGGGIDIHQFNNGPLYGDKTDEIIDYVFKNYHFEDAVLQYNYNVFKDHVTIKNGSREMKYIWIKDKHHNIAVTRIGEHAFENGLVKGIRLSQNLTHIDYCAFYNCKNLSSISLPKGLLIIGRSSFNGCESLKKLVLPQSVKSIGVYAFKNIKDLIITIPAGVQDIAENAFEGCINLKIYGEKGSFAESYALEKGYQFYCI